MNKFRNITTGLTLACALMAVGCQSSRVFYKPSLRNDLAPQQEEQIVLAADFGPQQDPAAESSDKPSQDKKLEENAEPENKSEKAEKPADKTKKVYTAPSAQIQQITLLALGIASLGTTGQDSVAEQASQSATTGGIVGRPELMAVRQSRFSSSVVSRPGLSQGLGANLGFARSTNIFTPTMNPLSGNNGTCAQLTTAGFFNNRAACENHFRR